MSNMPALSLAAMPGRRMATLDMAKEIERRGFSGIYCPSLSDSLSLCVAMALHTDTIHFGTSISPIYTRPVLDYAQTAAFIHELSGGRFHFGIGVSHEPAMERMGLASGKKPLSDIRAFVQEYHDAPRTGDKAPLVLATLRKKMIALAGEVGDGMVFANAARSTMPDSLSVLSQSKRDDPNFYIGNMVPTCISDDLEAAKAVNRRTLSGYVLLPNYRNYWKDAGYEEEMTAVERCVAAGQMDKVSGCLSDRWLADTTLFGTASQVREGVEAWYDAGIKTPILVPSSAAGNQMTALQEIFSTFS
jgi:alkanesulfonate monooxygenase SsuD/methylene tetrahydromethanopterin reductase-like flavin-dependent oxidoreductase (luciferase family)